MFAELIDADYKNELILIDGGIARFHIRRDGQCTIREILSQRRGCGQILLGRIIEAARTGACHSAVAKCPVDYEANDWWQKRGFVLDRVEETRTGKRLNVWHYQL